MNEYLKGMWTVRENCKKGGKSYPKLQREGNDQELRIKISYFHQSYASKEKNSYKWCITIPTTLFKMNQPHMV